MDLLAMLRPWLWDEVQRSGCLSHGALTSEHPAHIVAKEKRAEKLIHDSSEFDTPTVEMKPDFASPPRSKTTYGVSYAWREKRDGKVYDPFVDRLCEKALSLGIHVMRDIEDLGLGERISKFMTELAGQDRLFVILSHKYLHSENCMFELLEAWRYCQANKETFNKRVRIYRLDDAPVYDRDYRFQIIDHWTTAFEKAKPMIEKLAPKGVLDPAEIGSYNMMLKFAQHVSTLLHFFKDTLLAPNFEEFVTTGFADLE